MNGMAPSRKLVLLCGEDITTLIALNTILPEARERGFMPEVAFVKHRLAKDPQRGNLPELQRFGFVDRGLLKDVVYPFVEAHKHANPEKSKIATPSQLAAMGYSVHYVDSANEHILNRLSAGLEPGSAFVSLRCTEIIEQPAIDAAAQGGVPLVNIHPAPTTASAMHPGTRGLMAPMWDMANRAAYLGATIHHVDRHIDTGNVIEIKYVDPDYRKSQFENCVMIAPAMAELAVGFMDKLNNGADISGVPPSKTAYRTVPNAEQLHAWAKSGLVLHPEARKVVDIYTRLFGRRPNGVESQEFNGDLQSTLARAFAQNALFGKNAPTSVVHSSPMGAASVFGRSGVGRTATATNFPHR